MYTKVFSTGKKVRRRITKEEQTEKRTEQVRRMKALLSPQELFQFRYRMETKYGIAS